MSVRQSLYLSERKFDGDTCVQVHFYKNTITRKFCIDVEVSGKTYCYIDEFVINNEDIKKIKEELNYEFKITNR